MEGIEMPMVSVICLVYNHEKYVREALDGFVMQQTDFPFEVIIHDDASTDKSAEIIKEYEFRYPEIIKPIYQTENQYSKEKGRITKIVYGAAEGKYIALCEGDDYWTDPKKLQKQVEFMEGNEEYSLCFHATEHAFKDGQKNFIKRVNSNNLLDNYNVSMKYLIMEGGGAMATNSMVFLKKYVCNMPKWVANAPIGDLPLMLVLSSKGKVGYIDRVMGVYRRNAVGSWSKTMKNSKIFNEFHRGRMEMWKSFDKWSLYKDHSLVKHRLYKMNKQYYKRRIKMFFLE